jgi:predicted ArsR family transcriptional regulator
MTDDLYGSPVGFQPVTEGGVDLPLFDGPFAHSKIVPTLVERNVADLIFGRRRIFPVTIAEITEALGIRERTVKEIVEQLRAAHRCAIGASRQAPFGYFWIYTAVDRETAVRPYREQILTMFRTLRVLDSQAGLRELLGQLRLEVD